MVPCWHYEEVHENEDFTHSHSLVIVNQQRYELNCYTETKYDFKLSLDLIGNVLNYKRHNYNHQPMCCKDGMKILYPTSTSSIMV